MKRKTKLTRTEKILADFISDYEQPIDFDDDCMIVEITSPRQKHKNTHTVAFGVNEESKVKRTKKSSDKNKKSKSKNKGKKERKWNHSERCKREEQSKHAKPK